MLSFDLLLYSLCYKLYYAPDQIPCDGTYRIVDDIIDFGISECADILHTLDEDGYTYTDQNAFPFTYPCTRKSERDKEQDIEHYIVPHSIL